MRLNIRAHFDGRVFVPEERVDLPVDQAVTVQADVESPGADVQAHNEALVRFLSQPADGQGLPDWAMDREFIYDDRA